MTTYPEDREVSRRRDARTTAAIADVEQIAEATENLEEWYRDDDAWPGTREDALRVLDAAQKLILMALPELRR